MNLDKLILQKQNEAMHQNTLDIDWMNWDVSMEVILGEIERLADHLDDTLTRRRTVTRSFGLRKRKYASWIQKFRGIDVRLSRNHFYRVHVREWMKRQYKQLQKRHAVPIESLLDNSSDKEFVKQCYHCIFQRSPDDTGLLNNIRNLQDGKISKLELVFTMAKSPEGKAAGAHIKGKHMTYFLLRAYHSFRKIPLFGNILDKAMHVKGIHGVAKKNMQ